jgi:hypothetical protein
MVTGLGGWGDTEEARRSRVPFWGLVAVAVFALAGILLWLLVTFRTIDEIGLPVTDWEEGEARPRAAPRAPQ